MKVKKRVFCAILLLAMTMLAPCLLGCGGTDQSMTKDQMLAEAQEFDHVAFNEERKENEARAKENYDGKVFSCSGVVTSIREDYCIMQEYKYGKYINPVEVYFAGDELLSLSTGDEITVVGVARYDNYPNLLEFKEAYVV